MQFISKYSSPLGGILLAADAVGLTGLWLEGQRYFALYLKKNTKNFRYGKNPKNGLICIFRG